MTGRPETPAQECRLTFCSTHPARELGAVLSRVRDHTALGARQAALDGRQRDPALAPAAVTPPEIRDLVADFRTKSDVSAHYRIK